MSHAENSSRNGVTAAIGIVYLSAMLQGLTLVSFPALASILKQVDGLTDAQYGTIFLPQVVCTAVAAALGGALSRRVGLKTLLIIALALNALSQILLVTSVWSVADAYLRVLAGTASLGLGFGLSAAPLNAYPAQFFPHRRDTAVVALHSSLGAGLALGPVIAGYYVTKGFWLGFPYLLIAVATALALATAFAVPRSRGGETGDKASAQAGEHPLRSATFWLLVVIAVLYAFAEGTFSNWAVIYLHEDRGLTEATAGLALSVFWAALVVGRLGVSVLVAHIPAERLWLSLPLIMIAACLLIAQAHSATSGVALFALAGLGCSAFFPLTIARAASVFPHHVAWVSSMLIAALMLGVGLGSFMVGPLRASFALADLYRLSAVYPACALVLAACAVFLRRGKTKAE